MYKYCVINSRRGRGQRLFKGAVLITIFVAVFIMSGVNAKVFAYPSGEPGTQTNLNLDSAQDLLNVSQTVNEMVGEVVKGLTPTGVININTDIPILNNPLGGFNNTKALDTGNFDFKQFLSPTGVSSNDLVGILKAVAVLSIKIFITVLQVVWEIVQGLRGAFAS